MDEETREALDRLRKNLLKDVHALARARRERSAAIEALVIALVRVVCRSGQDHLLAEAVREGRQEVEGQLTEEGVLQDVAAGMQAQMENILHCALRPKPSKLDGRGKRAGGPGN